MLLLPHKCILRWGFPGAIGCGPRANTCTTSLLLPVLHVPLLLPSLRSAGHRLPAMGSWCQESGRIDLYLSPLYGNLPILFYAWLDCACRGNCIDGYPELALFCATSCLVLMRLYDGNFGGVKKKYFLPAKHWWGKIWLFIQFTRDKHFSPRLLQAFVQRLH